MVDKIELSFFKRFLKNKGLWNAFKKDVRKSEKFYKIPLRKFLNLENASSKNILMDCVLWCESDFREWGDMYIQYEKYFSENYEDYKKNYFSIKKEKL